MAYPIQISLVDVKPWVKSLGDILNAGIVEPISLRQHGLDSPKRNSNPSFEARRAFAERCHGRIRWDRPRPRLGGV